MNSNTAISLVSVPPPSKPPVSAVGSGGGGGGAVIEYKLRFDPTASVENIVLMPYGAKILNVKDDRGILTMYAFVNRGNPMRSRYFLVLPTDIEYEGYPGVYYGSASIGTETYHVFEK